MVDAIRIGSPAIEIALRRNPRARRMVLRVAQAGRGATLTLPPGVPLAKAQAFLSDHEGWLRRHLAARRVDRTLVEDGVSLPVADEIVTVRLVTTGRLERRGAELLVPGPAARIGPQVAAWLHEEARHACVSAVASTAAQLGSKPGRVTLRDPRSRWGSCTTTGDLMFSWRLILAPAAVLDYVVAHEVAHLVELNHSARFWAVVKRLRPDYEAHRDWLRKNGAGLQGWDFGTPPA